MSIVTNTSDWQREVIRERLIWLDYGCTSGRNDASVDESIAGDQTMAIKMISSAMDNFANGLSIIDLRGTTTPDRSMGELFLE